MRHEVSFICFDSDCSEHPVPVGDYPILPRINEKIKGTDGHTYIVMNIIHSFKILENVTTQHIEVVLTIDIN